jgi:hypothetical protein
MSKPNTTRGRANWTAYLLLLPAWSIACVAFWVSQQYFWTDALSSQRWRTVPTAAIVFVTTTGILYKPLLTWVDQNGRKRGDWSATALVIVGAMTYVVPFVVAFPAGFVGIFIPSEGVAPFLIAFSSSGVTYAVLFLSFVVGRPPRAGSLEAPGQIDTDPYR